MERRVIRDLQANAPTRPFRRRNAARQAGSGSVVAPEAQIAMVATLVGWESRSRCRSGNGGHFPAIGVASQIRKALRGFDSVFNGGDIPE